MKRKDVTVLVFAVVLLMGAGYLGFTQLAPKPSEQAQQGVEVVTVGAIPGALDTVGLERTKESERVKWHGSPFNLEGLNNTTPFGK